MKMNRIKMINSSNISNNIQMIASLLTKTTQNIKIIKQKHNKQTYQTMS